MRLPDGTTTDEVAGPMFMNSEGHWQVVSHGPDATCPTCGYPERHRIYEIARKLEDWALIADGCPSCETSRLPDRTIARSNDPAGW